MIFTLFAIYLTAAGAAVDLDNTPRNFADAHDCVRVLKQSIEKMKEMGVYEEGSVHVTCQLIQVAEIPHRARKIKQVLMQQARTDALLEHTAPWTPPAPRPVLPTIDAI